MSAYNKVNGEHCSQNAHLLTDILRKEFGFKGFVVSDWGSTYSTAATVNAGHGSGDARWPADASSGSQRPRTQARGISGSWLTAENVLAEVKAGHITEATLDRNVSRFLRVIFLSGLFDHPHTAAAKWTRLSSGP